jgi:EAL domain-containing protein (putative c-di-GMP-specific phosphodiesterase class I)
MRCPDCESFATHFFDTTRLYIYFPLDNSHAKFVSYIGKTSYQSEDLGDAVAITLSYDGIAPFLSEMQELFGNEEARQIKVLSKDEQDGTTALTISDFKRVMPLSQLIGLAQARWLIDMLEEERYSSLLQPLYYNDGQQVYGYEALVRGYNQDGTQINPGAMFGAAETAQLIFQLDLAARRSAVHCAHAHGLPDDQMLFINFNPSSIYDPTYCLKTTTSYIRELGMYPEQIVFEVTESGTVNDKEHLKGILSYYRKSGFKVALDDVGAGYSGLNMLEDVRPDFIKVDMHLVRDVDTDDYRQNIVRSLIDMGHSNGAQVICEGVETAEELAWLQHHGADFIQGFYLGRPAAGLAGTAA